MSRPCVCERCTRVLAAVYTPDQCRLCWLYHHDPAYRSLWQTAPCRHLGSATGETLACPSCRGTVALKLFACALHERCTLARPVPPVACCATCADRAATTDLRHEPGAPAQ